MSSFATKIGMLIFETVEKMTDEQILRLMRKVGSYSTSNCWYIEYRLKEPILTVCADVLESRKSKTMSAEQKENRE